MLREQTSCMVLTVLTLYFRVSEARIEVGSVRFGGMSDPGWQYIGKFGYGLGRGTYEAKVRAPQHELSLNVDLELFVDEDWTQAVALPPCSPELRALARIKKQLTAGSDWGLQASGKLLQNVRPHIWYFTLSTCNMGFNATEVVDFELHMYQQDGSELSVELRYMIGATLVTMLCLSAFVGFFIARCRYIRHGVGEVHPVILILACSLVLQWVSQVLHLLHLQLHETNGIGESGLETSADMLFMLSQVAISTLLIVMANGFSFLSSRGDELAAAKPIAAAVAFLHMVLVGYSKLLGDHADKHHDNGGVPGLGLVAVRVLLCSCFVARIKTLRQQHMRLEGFLPSFQLAGSMYFLAYPIIYVFAKVFAHYMQHPIMHLGLVAMQAAASLWLACLFLNRGSFFHVSALSCSILPGGMGCGGGKLD